MRIRAGAFMTALLAASLTASACTLITGPKSHEQISISVTSDTIVADVIASTNGNWLQFTIPVSIHNGTSAGLSVDFCLASILSANAGVVYEPVCVVDGPSDWPVVAPGETKLFQWPVSAAISGTGAPKWGRPTIDGTYRLILAMGAEAAWASNEFAISVSNLRAMQAYRATPGRRPIAQGGGPF